MRSGDEAWHLRIPGEGDVYWDVPLVGLLGQLLDRTPGWLFPSDARPGGT